MSERARSRSRGRSNEEVPLQLVEPVLAGQSADGPPQGEQPSTEREDITPGQQPEDEGEPEAEEDELESDVQRMSQPKTGGKRGDGVDVKGEFLSSLEPPQVPEAGEGQPDI